MNKFYPRNDNLILVPEARNEKNTDVQFGRVIESIDHRTGYDNYNNRAIYRRNYSIDHVVAFLAKDAHLFELDGKSYIALKEDAVLFVL